MRRRVEIAATLAACLAAAAELRAHRLPLSTDRPRQPDGRVLLAGDAASLINPLTGEGIFYAVLSGALAGAAAVRGAGAGAAHRRALHERLAAHLRPGGLMVQGFGLDAEHVPFTLPDGVPFPDLVAYDTACVGAGLTLRARTADWEGTEPYDGGGYAVSVHTLVT